MGKKGRRKRVCSAAVTCCMMKKFCCASILVTSIVLSVAICFSTGVLLFSLDKSEETAAAIDIPHYERQHNGTALLARDIPTRKEGITRFEKEILVVYSGPTSLNKSAGKNELYLHNFDFFLRYGLQCGFQDTIVTVTQEIYDFYYHSSSSLFHNCATLRWIIREPICHDMESLRMVLFNSTVDISQYHYFVYANCGVTGPSPHLTHWALSFLNPLSDTIKMTGLSINCFRKNSPHIQSMVYALDRVGLSIVMKSGSIFDCRNASLIRPGELEAKRFQRIVALYERGMSKAILQNGYGLAAVIPMWKGTVFWENRTNCTMFDRWSNKLIRDSFGGRTPTLNETIFFKTSRLLPKDIANLIQYPREPHWFAE